MSNRLSQVDSQGYFIPAMPIPLRGEEGNNPTFFERLAFMRKVINDPLEVFADFHFEQPFSTGQFNRSTNVVINDPQLIRHCFVDNVSNYKHAFLRQSLLKPVLGDGLLTIEGDQWRNSRKAIAPIFVPRHVHGFAEVMKQTCEAYLTELDQRNTTVLISQKMSELTYLILSETLFSGEINEDADAMLKEVAFLLEHMGRPDIMDMLRIPLWVPRISKIRGLSSILQFRKFVARIIRKRKNALESGDDVPADFLTLLLKAEADGNRLTLKVVEDNIITFIAAGHETTARAVTWTLYLLSQASKFREFVEAEIDSLDMDKIPPADWINHLPWTTACFDEAMRLYPPAAIITRTAIEEDDFQGYHIPKDAQIILAPWILHRHKMLWEHPERFDPERFYGENRSKPDRFAYLPFGVGPRVCIGATFAMQEGVIILAVLLKHLRFEYASKAPPWPVLKITLQPDNDMPMRLYDRA